MKPDTGTSTNVAGGTFISDGELILIPVLILALCYFGWMTWESVAFPKPFNKAEVGAARVPLIAAAGGGLTSLAILAHIFIGKSHHIERVEIQRPLGVMAVLILTIIWVAAMPRVGFYIASVFVVPLIMFAGGERRPTMLLSSAIGFVVFVHLCFALLLDIEFP